MNNKVLIGFVLLIVLWHPIRPLRHFVADTLTLTADLLR